MDRRPVLIVIDDVCDQPMSEEQRRLVKRWWAKAKRRGHWRCTPFTSPDPLVKIMRLGKQPNS